MSSTALHYPYGWWERDTVVTSTTPSTATRVVDGAFGEVLDVGTYTTRGSARVSAATSARVLHAATSFDERHRGRAEQLLHLRADILRLQQRVDQARALRRTLVAHQIGQLATAVPSSAPKNLHDSLADACRRKAQEAVADGVAPRTANTRPSV